MVSHNMLSFWIPAQLVPFLHRWYWSIDETNSSKKALQLVDESPFLISGFSFFVSRNPHHLGHDSRGRVSGCMLFFTDLEQETTAMFVC